MFCSDREFASDVRALTPNCALHTLIYILVFESKFPYLVVSLLEGKCELRDVIHSPLAFFCATHFTFSLTAYNWNFISHSMNLNAYTCTLGVHHDTG